MLASIRKFSSSIYSKILLGIIIIPFVFWGMGSSFTGGSKNIIVLIDKEKYSTQEFIDFIRKFAPPDKEINDEQIEEFLSFFIGENLIKKEVDSYKIKLSNDSLGKLIKHQKDFKRENNFSRIEYEKFLLKNNISAVSFESSLKENEKKKQLIDFIGGGILPSKFLVNSTYDKINQKRNVQLINLSDFFKKESNFSEDQIKSYYETNKDNFKEIYKSVKILELNPKNLINSDEFNDLFFKKLDEIDNIIMQDKNLDFIVQKFNLEKVNTFFVNDLGKDINSRTINNIPKNIVKNIFTITSTEPIALIENEDKYFIVEVTKTENILKGVEDKTVRKKILLRLETEIKRKLISQIISKIKQNNFIKSDFDELSNENKLTITKIALKNQNDNKTLKQELLNEIYSAPEKKVIVVHDLNMTENYLIYIDKIENVTIDEKSEEYTKYLNLSRKKIANNLFNTWDKHIKKKYEIDINYKALGVVKNYFN